MIYDDDNDIKNDNLNIISCESVCVCVCKCVDIKRVYILMINQQS